MKKKRLLMLLGSVCLALMLVVPLAVACAGPAPVPTPTPTPAKPTPTPTPAPKVKPIVFRFADKSPPAGIRGDGLRHLKECLEEGTNGRVELEIYFAGSLVSATEALAACEQGTCDIASDSPGKHVSEVPHWEVLGTITHFPGPDKQIDLFRKALDEIPEFPEDYAKLNQKIWGFHHIPSITLYVVEPVDSIWDLKGKTIRVYCPPHATMIEALGALPVYLPMSECYMAMERGTIDGVLTPFESGFRFRFHEAAKGVMYCDTMWAGTVEVMSINIDSFNKLSAADQKVFMDCGRDMTEFIVSIQNDKMDEMFAEITGLGDTLMTVPKADQDRWASDPKVKALPDEWGKKMDASHIVDKLRELAAEAMK